MTRANRYAAVLVVLAAGMMLGVGCGPSSNSCATETPQVNSVPTCSNIQAGSTVTVGLNLCPTCNQTDPSCTIDLSQVASSNIIQLDPLVHACEGSNNCPPSCEALPVTCTFQAPSTPDTYTILVADQTGTPIEKTFTVVGSGGSSSCGI